VIFSDGRSSAAMTKLIARFSGSPHCSRSIMGNLISGFMPHPNFAPTDFYISPAQFRSIANQRLGIEFLQSLNNDPNASTATEVKGAMPDHADGTTTLRLYSPWSEDEEDSTRFAASIFKAKGMNTLWTRRMTKRLRKRRKLAESKCPRRDSNTWPQD
jgi:hypothetical protein